MQHLSTAELVGFFGFDDKKNRKIISFVENYFREQDISSESDAEYRYRLIAKIVENQEYKFNFKTWNKVIDPTDSNAHFDNPVLKIIGTDDPQLVKFIDGSPDDELLQLPLDDIIQLLNGHTSKRNLELLRYISKMGVSHDIAALRMHPDQLISNIHRIEEKLDALVSEFEREGKLVIPARPIIQIDWMPDLHIRFGKRDWSRMDGTAPALEWFNRYGHVYHGMSRYELFKKDSGLYKRLERENTLDKAIPKSMIRDYSAKSALEYFKEEYAEKKITRRQLKKDDPYLYNKLLKEHTLDEAIPKKTAIFDLRKTDAEKSESQQFIGQWALDYFKENYAGIEITRSKLKRENNTLYQILLKDGTLEIAIPPKHKDALYDLLANLPTRNPLICEPQIDILKYT